VRAGGRTTWRADGRRTGRAVALGLPSPRRALAVLLVAALAAAVLTTVVSLAPPAQAVATLPTLSTRVCAGYSGLNASNPYASVRTGLYTSGGRTAKRVFIPPATATTTAWGTPVPLSVSWSANPYSDTSWQVWFHSLKWLGSLVLVGGGRSVPDPNTVLGYRAPTTDERWDALDLALGATKNYLDTYRPTLTTRPTTIQANSMAHRAQFLACLIETMGVANAPSWLLSDARAHVGYLRTHYAGAWNQGIDQDLGILTIGCVIGPGADRDFAVNRLTTSLDQAIGPDGVPLEQAPGYSGYQYTLWKRVVDVQAACGLPTDGVIADRIAGIPEFLSQATQPNGTMVQLGDSVAAKPPVLPGSQFAASLGASGVAPAERVKIFSPSGFIFGRSSWTPFTTRSFYSLRFGPAVANHGHADRTSVTWTVRGVDRIVDSGHVGYANSALRARLVAPDAHNLLSADQFVGFRAAKRPSHLLSSSVSDGADAFLIDAQGYYFPITGGTGYTLQKRGTLVVRGPDLLVVRDSAGGAPKPVTWRQHWHLPPGWTAAVRTANVVEAASGSLRTTFVRIPPRTGAVPALIAGSVQAPQIGVARANLDVQFPATGRSTGAITVVAPVSRSSLSVSVSGSVLTVVSGGVTVRIALNPDGSMTRLS